jgi:hypothetical protein
MAIDATKLRRGVRKLGEPPTDSNPELSAPTAVHTHSSGATPTAMAGSGVMAAGPLAETPPPAAAIPPPQAEVMPPPQAEIPPTRVEFPRIISSAPAGSTGAGRYIDGRSRRRTGRIEQINVKVSSQFNGELRGLADRENILIVEALERALNAYLRLVATAEASGQTVDQVLDNLRSSP